MPNGAPRFAKSSAREAEVAARGEQLSGADDVGIDALNGAFVLADGSRQRAEVRL